MNPEDTLCPIMSAADGKSKNCCPDAGMLAVNVEGMAQCALAALATYAIASILRQAPLIRNVKEAER